MVFELTEKLAEEILQALENQDSFFVLDAETMTLLDSSSVKADDDRFYALPEWNSKDGYELRMLFVEGLGSSPARQSLKTILHSGRGVFKNFKNELKQFPEVEKKWHLFKNNRMRLFIDGWYNSLREIWGLERLPVELDENDDLVHNDFSFRKFSSSDKEPLIKFAESEGDFIEEWPEKINVAVKELWTKQFLNSDVNDHTGFVCCTLNDDFAGCITVAPVSERTKDIVVLTSFYVRKSFRGLGIGTELLDMCLSELKSLSIKWVLLTNLLIPESLEPMLLKAGFEKTGSGYSAKLQ